MQYRSVSGEIAWRPLQDINARLTMGRVALGLRRLSGPNDTADWLHIRASSASHPIPIDGRVIRTSPQEVGGRPATLLTALVINTPRGEG